MGVRISKETARELGRQGAAQRKQNVIEREKLMFEFVNSKLGSYEEFMEQLRQGKEVGENERQFMDRLEKQFEFAFPKLSRAVLTGENGTALFPLEQAQKILQKNQ